MHSFFSALYFLHADPCSEGDSWQVLSGAKHSSGHKNFAGWRSLENLYDNHTTKEGHRKNRGAIITSRILIVSKCWSGHFSLLRNKTFPADAFDVVTTQRFATRFDSATSETDAGCDLLRRTARARATSASTSTSRAPTSTTCIRRTSSCGRWSAPAAACTA